MRLLDRGLIKEAVESTAVGLLGVPGSPWYCITSRDIIQRLVNHLEALVNDYEAEEVDGGIERSKAGNECHVWYKREDVPKVMNDLRKRIRELEEKG